MKEDGVVSKELWKFNLGSMEWELLGGSHKGRGSRRRNSSGSRRKNEHKRHKNNRGEDKYTSYNHLGEEITSRQRRAEAERPSILNKYSSNDDETSETKEECTWSSPGPCPPLASVGHAAVVVDNKYMLIIFGHSSRLGYLNVVQQYHFGKNLIEYST